MIYYLDITWCPYYRECAKGAKCDRALTPAHQAAAERAGLLVAQFLEKPPCFEVLEKPENDHGCRETRVA